MSTGLQTGTSGQHSRNKALLESVRYLGDRVESQVLPLQVDIATVEALSEEQIQGLEGLRKEAAETAIRALGELAKIGEVDHLGGGLELIPGLLLTLAVSDYEKIEYTIEHAHTSIGYFAALAALGFVEPQAVIDGFRRGLDIPGHVSWLPGGTQLNGGRLGVMVPVAVGQALGKKGTFGEGSWVVAHCGDAGWISGQALNGFNGADVHGAPITFVMHRNGIQLSGSTKSILDKDPRSIIAAMGIEIVETTTLHDPGALYAAYRECYALAQQGRPSMLYPTGYTSADGEMIDLAAFGQLYGLGAETEAFAEKNGVSMDREIWIPGSLMSFGDTEAMLECLFLVNDLPGGKGHHDGHMKGREVEQVLAGPLLQKTEAQAQAVAQLREQAALQVVTAARPAPGSENLAVADEEMRKVELPGAGKKESPRAGSEAGYAVVAKQFPENLFVVSCDLDASTKLGKARSFLAADHQFEMSIEEQAAALLANGLALSGREPQLNVVSTFAAFFEGIAREGFDMWRYQRNLNGVNEGLNVVFHLSHVGACTGRDHFSGWGLDWINIGLTYMHYLHRFYAPADARAAFLAVLDLAAHYGGHVIGIPRDSLPILEKQDGSGPLWEANAGWEHVTAYRTYPKAAHAILALGAPAFLAAEATAQLTADGTPVDVHIINGLPLPDGVLGRLIGHYPQGVVTVEDGLIGCRHVGVRGFAGLVSGAANAQGLPVAHVGITDPRIAPSEGHMETWEHFGITVEGLIGAVKSL